jgi:hypothetical protein
LIASTLPVVKELPTKTEGNESMPSGLKPIHLTTIDSHIPTILMEQLKPHSRVKTEAVERHSKEKLHQFLSNSSELIAIWKDREKASKKDFKKRLKLVQISPEKEHSSSQSHKKQQKQSLRHKLAQISQNNSHKQLTQASLPLQRLLLPISMQSGNKLQLQRVLEGMLQGKNQIKSKKTLVQEIKRKQLEGSQAKVSKRKKRQKSMEKLEGSPLKQYQRYLETPDGNITFGHNKRVKQPRQHELSPIYEHLARHRPNPEEIPLPDCPQLTTHRPATPSRFSVPADP